MSTYLFISSLDIIEQLDLFLLYVNDVEEFIDAQAKKYEQIVESYNDVEWKKNAWGLEEPPDEGIQAYLRLGVFEGYPGLLRSSLFIWLCTFLENILMKECGQNLDTDYKDSKNIEIKKTRTISVLDKVKKCFSENLHSKYQFGVSKEWSDIKKYQTIRNCLVHAGGNLERVGKKDSDKIESFAEHNPEILSLYENDKGIEIFIDKGFCESYIALISKFLEDLNNAGRST